MPKTKTKRLRHRRKSMKGGLPIRMFYPQNQYTTDPQRMMTTGGGRSPSARRHGKNHSRKYLKGGWGFMGNFGTLSGASSNTNMLVPTGGSSAHRAMV